MKTWKTLCVLGLAVAGSVAAASDEGSATRPNILVIMTDDLRMGMLQSEGHPYMVTPNLDRFTTEGVRFNNCYATSPVCGPSRASIFTGQYSTVHMRRDNFYYPDSFNSYLPQHFKDAGYNTALIGKYYEGDQFRNQARQAWNRWFVNLGPDPAKRTPGMSHEEWWNTYLYQDQQYSVDGERIVLEGHQTDILFAEAARFVGESDEPFCVFLSPFSPHTPLNMTERNRGKYRGYGIPDRPNLEMTKGYFRNKKKLPIVTEMYEQYCEMITDIDDGMGVLFEALEQSGQLDNTLIIFTSDNGLMYGEHGFAWKRHAWEESAKVPFYIRYPKLAKPGTENDALVSLADIFYTCADLGDVEFPEIEGGMGRSMLPLLTGEQAQIRNEFIQIEYNKPDRQNPVLPEVVLWASVIRPDGWKLSMYQEPAEQRPDLAPIQMFQLSHDALEMDNLAANPEFSPLLESLQRQLKTGLIGIGADDSWLKTN
ncbi:sulfatase-like hydrolase/transferase [Coraliomargarita sp. SDUM461003]|uniref:Sulfatase-like hydrolase/transferase n=1 Tax=Thalassobacterium maritimum TaxID=3041265 RepID=A0ABU1AQJ1_9BACT|nr:sulfatase-like hydrolase/transferase [Coraliomargarita sp. SDUM461003]MDQ8206376.1 sulfatase-like hydrolase/transferase [Coraliomargarita sp. SDUM461003]